MSKKGLHSITLFEILVVLIVCIGFGVFLIRPMRIARQTAVAKPMTDLGARTATNSDRSIHRLDATRMPADEIRMDQIVSLGDLTYLNLDHSEITDADLAPVAEHLDLRELHLVATEVTDKAVDHIAKMKNLVLLDARATFLTDEGIAGLTGLAKLRFLRIAQTWITDAALDSIAKFPNLGFLDLRYSGITEAGLAKIAAMNSLTEVRLTGAHVRHSAVNALREQRPDLKVEYEANDGYNFESRVILRQKNYKNRGSRTDPARKFRLSERKIGQELEAIGASVVSRNGFIARVVCHQPGFTDHHLQQLMWCRGLTSLKLRNVSITASGWSMIHRNIFLTRIDLQGVKVDVETVGNLSRIWLMNHLKTDGMTDDAFMHMHSRAHSMDLNGSPITDRSIAKMTRDRFPRLSYILCGQTEITEPVANTVEKRFKDLHISTPEEIRRLAEKQERDAERRRAQIKAQREQAERDRIELERMVREAEAEKAK